jgi:hypothetical protein
MIPKLNVNDYVEKVGTEKEQEGLKIEKRNRITYPLYYLIFVCSVDK